MKKSAFLLFPNQLFKQIDFFEPQDHLYLIEEFLFFKQYKFHKQKLVFHRASMKYYENYLIEKHFKINYIESISDLSDIRKLIQQLHELGISEIKYFDVCDNWLEKRIAVSCKKHGINIVKFESPLFLNSTVDLNNYFGTKSKYFQADFYTQQRKLKNILIDNHKKPIGGKWSFDEENRLKYPKNKVAPKVHFPTKNQYYLNAIDYVENHFKDNYGNISPTFIYPTTHIESENWLIQFFENRFREFGHFEDAIVQEESILNHSVLTPMLNVGLLTPAEIIDSAIEFSKKYNIELNSLEGFIRQIIGWREFIRGVYLFKGTQQRITNFWNFKNKIPKTFYNGTTGIEPIDETIKKIIETGYCHHIERLMVLGNFMLLCEFDPNEVYQWFMELFIDSYDWVMVPNIYGMSQFSDGGLMATKPYISGSSYVLKMSNYKKGHWSTVWDGLFWHFMNKHRNFFLSNPRIGMLIKTFDKMDDVKKETHLSNARKFLIQLSN